MKAEINNENKVRFFHQYALQYVTSNKGRCCLRDADFIDEIEWIQLTPLSGITDEDAIDLAKIWYDYDNAEAVPRDGKRVANGLERSLTYNTKDSLIAFDFLRSKGYAVSWRGLSVEEMIEAGWIKLKK